MDSDVVLTFGVIMAVLSVYSVLNALSEGSAPRIGAIVALISAGLISYAITLRPGGYVLADVPMAVVRAFGRVLN